MIMENGIMWIKLEVGNNASFNENGEPLAIDNSCNWGSPIPCFIQTNSRSNKGTYEDGNFTIAKYEILIENSISSESSDIAIGRVKLVRDSKPLGEFVVQDVQVLSSVGRIKIIV